MYNVIICRVRKVVLEGGYIREAVTEFVKCW